MRPVVALGFQSRLRDKLLNVEVFDALQEAKVLIKQWHHYHNTKRPRQGQNIKGRTPQKAFTDGPAKQGKAKVNPTKNAV